MTTTTLSKNGGIRVTREMLVPAVLRAITAIHANGHRGLPIRYSDMYYGLFPKGLYGNFGQVHAKMISEVTQSWEQQTGHVIDFILPKLRPSATNWHSVFDGEQQKDQLEIINKEYERIAKQQKTDRRWVSIFIELSAKNLNFASEVAKRKAVAA
jgi:hypothetical protein